MKSLLVALILALPVAAQTAKVIQLSPEDAKQAKLLDEAASKAQKNLADFNESIRQKYLKAGSDEQNRTQDYNFNGTWIWVKPGWGTGQFEYSEDFRFIVPAKAPPSNNVCLFGSSCGSLQSPYISNGSVTQ